MPSQTISLVLGSNAAAYNLASGSASPTPVTFANQRVGGTLTQALTVSNTAPAGSFTEVLNASFGANTGFATNNGGSISGGLNAGGVAAGGPANTTAMSVGLDTSVAGARTGSVTLNYVSNGTGTSGLAPVGVGSQTINVSGNVYQAAIGQLNTPALNFGTVQVGQSVSQTLSISNIATGAAGFVEDLNARFGVATGVGSSLITGTGSISGLLAGATNASGMVVGVNTSAAGTVNGAIPVNFYTAGAVNGASNGLGESAVGSADFGVVGIIQAIAQVVDQARPVINNPVIDLGNVRINTASPTQYVSVTNQATGNPQAALNASISAGAPVTASGSFNLLAPGGTNANTLQVGLNTSTAGARNGTATVAFVSDASNVGNCEPNCQLTLASQNVTVQGNVYRLAQGQATDPVTLANFRVGSSIHRSAHRHQCGGERRLLRATQCERLGQQRSGDGDERQRQPAERRQREQRHQCHDRQRRGGPQHRVRDSQLSVGRCRHHWRIGHRGRHPDGQCAGYRLQPCGGEHLAESGHVREPARRRHADAGADGQQHGAGGIVH